MLQIVILGMCIMLVVKAIDMLQRKALAQNPENGGGVITIIGVSVAFIGAVILFAMSEAQVSEMPDFSASQSAPDLLADPLPGGY
ncbi:MAG: hypothetical protein CVT85_05435 [Alphaproteobacteria bacterium HGW-Alphaproteobacteria-7]|jgi:hypothetical protein|nr:MAG: hypothetical protein CVT85_05435 [Alphaproteobacteria bacterium HGW-Alphaproteobacteria-7]